MPERTRRPLAPSEGQKKALGRVIRASNHVFNEAVDEFADARQNNDKFLVAELYQCLVAEAYCDPEREWLTKVSVDPLLNAVRDARDEWWSYMRRLAEGKEADVPARPRGNMIGARFGQDAFCLVGGWREPRSLLLDGVGNIPVEWTSQLPVRPDHVIITRRNEDEWFAQFPIK